MNTKILIVEDDKEIGQNLQELLESEGYSVDLATNGKEALTQLTSMTTLPSLILLDLMMPIMDGFQFRKEQESNLKFSNVPVVVMTADGHIAEKRMRIGAKAFLRKPFEIDEILKVIKLYALS